MEWNLTREETHRAVMFLNDARVNWSDGELIVTLPDEKQPHPPCVAFVAQAPENFGRETVFNIRFEGSADRNVSATMHISNAAPPYEQLSSQASFQLTTELAQFTSSIQLARPLEKGEKITLPILRFFGEPGTVIKVKTLAVTAASETPDSGPVTIEAGTDFRALTPGRLYVEPGSALDFSGLVEWIPAGALGRVIVNGRGELAFEKRPDEAVRFFCCSFAHHEEIAFRFYTHRELEEFADAIARQGYNMIRFHYLDEMLSGSKRGAYLREPEKQPLILPESADEIQFEPGVLDRFLYFVAACGKRGIYVNLDLMSSFIGYDNGLNPLLPRAGDRITKTQLLINDAYRRNWKAGAERLLRTVNPYNGLRLNEDPAVTMVCGLNEQEILIPPRDYRKAFQVHWIAYLRRKYRTLEALREAWGRPEIASFDAVPPVDEEISKNTPAGRDMARFCAGLEAEMSEFYLEAMREFGGEILLGNWNMRPRLIDVPARSKLPLTMLNYYHAHPIYGQKTVVSQESAIQMGGNLVKQFAAMRLLDRPLVITEYGATFWNRFRHEEGLLIGAGAALQNWSGLTVFSSPVIYGTSRIECFRAGADPVIRAAQAVEFFAFRRGDVASARNTVAFAVDDEIIFNGNAMRGINDSLSRLWALCRIGILYGKERSAVDAVLRIRPEGMGEVGGDGNYSTTAVDLSGEPAAAVVGELRRRGALPEENLTNPEKGIFQSDTGEVFIDMPRGELSVVTPRLAGAVLKESARRQLGPFTIEMSSVPASLTLVAIDRDSTLTEAGRLLLIFATDALNSKMKFTAPDRNTLIDYGTTPVLVETGKFSVTLKRARSGEKFRLYALDLTGRRIAELPLAESPEPDVISFAVDTAAIPGEPALFFELERQK